MCLGAFVWPEVGTDTGLLETQIFLPHEVLIGRILETKLIFTYCECAPDGEKTNKSCLFSPDEKGKEIHVGFVHNTGSAREQRRMFLSSVFVGNARCALCAATRILPAHWAVALGSAK